MEINVPKLLDDAELRAERISVIREMSRLTVYLGCLNDELSERTTYINSDNNVIGLFE